MNGLEAVEMKLSEVITGNVEFRFDTDFFQKKYLKNNALLAQTTNEKLLFYIADLKSFGAYSLCNQVSYIKEGIPFLRCLNIKNGVAEFENVLFIDKESNDLLWKSEVKPNMVLITMSGTVGNTTVALDTWNYPINSNQDIAKLLVKNLNPFFLSTFLSSRFGLLQMQRLQAGAIQQHLYLSQIEKLVIPSLSNDLEIKIEEIVKLSFNKLDSSKVKYKQAETLLLDELGLHNWQPTKANTEVKSFKNTFLQSGRLDAEYYQPKYDEIEKAIRSNSVYYKSIAEIKTFNARGLQPEYFADGELAIINSKHILENTLDYDDFEKTDSSFWNTQQRARVYKDDILTYTTGVNIGRTQIYLSKEKALASNHVNILRIKNENPIYVAFVMNSLLGRLQTEKLSAGSAQQELYPKDIDSFLIPFIDEKAQEKIANNVIECLQLQEQSQHLLQVAKHAVEIAIEQSEEAAMELIKAQTAL